MERGAGKKGGRKKGREVPESPGELIKQTSLLCLHYQFSTSAIAEDQRMCISRKFQDVAGLETAHSELLL